LGAVLEPGDAVLLVGEVGAGKSYLARHLIQSLIGADEDVPSPTFTLVQAYSAPAGELWHADLYRLSDISEIEELGLIDALENSICLIEWPDRLGSYQPKSALTVALSDGPSDDSRLMTLSWADPRWVKKDIFS